MDGDMVTRLQELQAKVTEFGALASRLAAAVPERAEGSDRSGYAVVVLNRDGLPGAIRVRDGWARHIEPAVLGAAVMEAHADAVRRGMSTWSRNVEDRGGEAQAEVTVPDGAARPPGELNEDILKALRTVQEPRPAPAGATAADGPVRLTFGAGGLVDCVIDPGWAARQDGRAITAALTTALTAAPSRAPATDVDALLGDALATLRAVTEGKSVSDLAGSAGRSARGAAEGEIRE